MESLIGIVGLALLVVVYLRKYLLRKESPKQQAMPLDGELYAVGQACIARRASSNPQSTVVVMPGLVENFLYFTEYYSDPSIELIMLTSADYHVPVSPLKMQSPSWAVKPSARPGTIAYDATVLNLALEHLVSTEHVRVHGHSRGGAVILEAARQQPVLFDAAEVILEAPVLPQGKPYAEMPGWARWFLPFLLPLWQQQPISERNRATWGPLDNPRKRELIMAYPFNAKRAGTMMTNIQDIEQWMKETGTDIYRHVRRGAILVPGDDHVLQSKAMLASARQAENLQVIQIENGSHFVIADNPDSIPPLARL
ncbi:MAG: alpha/beta hydrolase [Pseudomonas sp.]